MSRPPSGWTDNISISSQNPQILLRRAVQYSRTGRIINTGKARAFQVLRGSGSPRIPAHNFLRKVRRSLFESMATMATRQPEKARLCKWLRCCNCICVDKPTLNYQVELPRIDHCESNENYLLANASRINKCKCMSTANTNTIGNHGDNNQPLRSPMGVHASDD